MTVVREAHRFADHGCVGGLDRPYSHGWKTRAQRAPGVPLGERHEILGGSVACGAAPPSPG